MDIPLTVTLIKRPTRDFTLKTVPTGSVVEFDNGNIGITVYGFVVILINDVGNIDLTTLKKSDIGDYGFKYLGQLTGIIVQEK